jgi:hypothetical protein
MTLEEMVRETLSRHSSDEIMLDAFIQWASNPTSMSAGYGVEENYSFIASNLQDRYGLSSSQASGYIDRLRHDCECILEATNDVYQVRSEVLRQLQGELGKQWRKGMGQQLGGAPTEIRSAGTLLCVLAERGYSTSRWEDLLAPFQAYYMAAYGTIVSPVSVRNGLLKAGMLNRLFWISSKRLWDRQDYYVLPPLPPAASIGLAGLEKAPTDREVRVYVRELFERRRFEQLRVLDEVSRENFGARTYYGIIPSFLSSKGVCGQHANTIAISPFVLDQVRDTLHQEKQTRLEGFESRIENALVTLRNKHWPDCELIFTQMEGEHSLWRWDSSGNPKLYLYLALSLTAPDLRALTYRIELTGNQSIMVIVAYQSIPSAKEVLETSFGPYRSMNVSLLLPTDKGLRYELTTGEDHAYARPIVEVMGKALGADIDVKPPQPSPVSFPEPPPTPPVLPTPPGPPVTELRVLLGTAGAAEIFWAPAIESSWNFAIVGSAGTGKTQTVKAILKEFVKQGIPYIVFDFRNDYVPIKSSTSDFGSVLDLSHISINPLELDGSNSPRDQKYQVSDIIDLVYTIGERQIAYIRDAIRLSYEDNGINEDKEGTWAYPSPTFADIQQNLERLAEEGSRTEKDSIKGIFARLDPIFDYGIFSAKTVMPFEDLIKGRTIVNLGVLLNDNLKAVVCEFLLRKLRYYLYSLPESREPRLFIVIDEAHRLKYEKTSSTGQLLKEARKYGVGLTLSTQDPVDFPDLVYNNIGAILSLQLTDPKYAKSIAEHLGGRVGWQSVKNDLSEKFSAFVKYSSRPDVIKFRVTPHYERQGQD